MIIELVMFCTLTLGSTMVVAFLPGVMKAHAFLSIPVCVVALVGAALAFEALAQDQPAAIIIGVGVACMTIAMRLMQRRWSWVAAQMFVSVVLSSSAYLVYAALQTFATELPALAIAVSIFLLFVEVFALALSVSYCFEVVDVLGRRELEAAAPPLTRTPCVALQVATYNEPVEVVQGTLESLARIDYPNFLVQVVDNNTKDPAIWEPLQELCVRLGPRFSFLHLDPWPGFKAGALNEATRRLPAEVEVLGIIDADYNVRPEFLHRMVGHFDDPNVAFAQSSQHYRDWENDRYLRGLFYSFRYFFDISMPARHHRNAIIFCGTMGLVRRSVLEEIGGWSETCITEDAEASLRILGRGHRCAYDRSAYGAGMMPLSFDGLKKQRFRWCLGGIQILREHWRELVPLGHHRLRLTMAQRIHYLLGSVQWFGDLLMATFMVLLLLTALTTALHHQLPLRQLTGAVLAIPIAFAGTGVLRALWAMRMTTGATFPDSVKALRIWFALSWVVSIACLRGLVSKQAEFLRTPKRHDGASVLQALRSCRAETALAAAGAIGAAAMIVRSPGFTTGVLGALLLFEAAVYSSAPWASVAAERVAMTPERRRFLLSPQNTGERPALRRMAVAVPAILAVGGAAAAAVLILSSPSDQAPFGGGQRDLPSIGQLVPNLRGVIHASPSPSATSSPSSTPSATQVSSPSSGVSTSTTGSTSSSTIASSAAPSWAVSSTSSSTATTSSGSTPSPPTPAPSPSP